MMIEVQIKDEAISETRTEKTSNVLNEKMENFQIEKYSRRIVKDPMDLCQE